MQTPAPLYSPSLLRAGLRPVAAAAAFLLGVNGALALTKSTAPASITSLSQTLPTVAGVPTLLTVTGTGDCKYRVVYTRQEAAMTLQTQWTYSSTPQNPFPMRLKLFDATPPGNYTWIVTGIDGCMGSQRLSFTVQ